MKNIKCPYCFHEFDHDEVLFRSEKVNKGDSDILPENYYEYENFDDLKDRYNGSDKQKVLDYAFFMETSDEIYEAFWRKYNGTTEDNPVDQQLGIKSYMRRILDPKNPEHQHYLKKQGSDYFIRDEDEMVIQIELNTDEKCNRRVCPHCHNPLPDNYGQNPVKFASVMGITAAGKTVYLSQLLKGMKNYAVKVGLGAIVNNVDSRTFIEKNLVKVGDPLPNSTETMKLQQPLFYEMTRNDKDGNRIIETFVLYDVAGEVFQQKELISSYAPFIENSDGFILLLDPMQFNAFYDADKTNDDKMKEVTIALDAIHSIATKHGKSKKSDIPCAICISKTDMKVVQEVLDDELVSMLKEDVITIKNNAGFPETIFNAKNYNPIFKKLNKFYLQNEPSLALTINQNYSHYAYFAFSALGCDVEEKVNDLGIKYRYPKGPILPKRIEEPLLWLFCQFGYIIPNEELFDPSQKEVHCPACDSEQVSQFELKSKKVKINFIQSKKIKINCHCRKCGYEWREKNSDD